MTTYVSPMPFEHDHHKPMAHATREQHPQHNRYSGRPSISPDSLSFDISAAWYNHPLPFNLQTAQPKTSHPALRHSPTCQRKTSHPPVQRPQFSYRSSSESAVYQDIENLPHCSCCGLLRAPTGSIAEPHHCHMCADIERERECPDTHSPSTADVVKVRSHEPNSPTHHHRRHSLFYEPPLHVAPEEMKLSGIAFVSVQQIPDLLEEQRSSPLDEESRPLHVETTLLEEESTPLEQESTPLNHAHVDEDPYVPGAAEQLYRLEEKRQEAKSCCRAEAARRKLWFGHARRSSAAMAESQRNGAVRADKEDCPKDMTEVADEEDFYGKYL